MAHIHPGNPGTPAPTNTNPFGSKNSCGRANLKLTEFVKLAQEAWYSKKPTVKHANHTEFRKHPDHDRYFHLKEYDGDYYLAYASEAVDRKPVFEVHVTGYDRNEGSFTEGDREALKKQPARDELVIRNETAFGENFTVDRGLPFFLHRCFDGTVKELRLSPDPVWTRQPCEIRKLKVFLPKESAFFKGAERHVARRTLQGFLANKGENDAVAFEHLERLLELENLRTVEEKRRTPLAGRRKWRGTKGQFFRYTNKDRNEIEQYNPDRRSRPVYRRPAQPHASLSHRKLALYGFMNQAHSDLF